MRVLHFLPAYAPAWQFGGPILSVSRLCEGLVKQGVDVRVITTNAGLPHFPKDQLGIPQDVNGVEVIYYPVNQQGGMIRSSSLVTALAEHINWGQLLHLSSIWQPLGIPVQRAALAAEIPVIQSLRGALGPYSLRRGWWKKIPYFLLKEKPLLDRVSALHCTTDKEAREIQWLGLKPPIHILGNPVDLSQMRCEPELGKAWRKTSGIPAGKPLFLVAGRMHHKKGLDILPNIFARITDRPWHLLFVGNDDDGSLQRLKQSFKSLGLGDRCTWMPSVPPEQLVATYSASDWLLLPSLHENFGNVVVEALSCGCGAVITPEVGVSTNIFNCPGVHVVARKAELWTNCLHKLLSTNRPSFASALWVQPVFDKDTLAADASHIYSKILAGSI